jgi:hypothetical protein
MAEKNRIISENFLSFLFADRADNETKQLNQKWV